MTSLSSALLSNLKLTIFAPSYRHGPRPPVYASNRPSLQKRTILDSLLNLTSIRVLYGKDTFTNKFPSSLKIFIIKRNKIQLGFDNVYRAKNFLFTSLVHRTGTLQILVVGT